MTYLKVTKQTKRLLIEALISHHAQINERKMLIGYRRTLRRQKQIELILKKVRGY